MPWAMGLLPLRGALFKHIYITIPMQTTHLLTKEELLISNRFDWYGLKEKAYKKKSAHSQQSENFLSLRIR